MVHRTQIRAVLMQMITDPKVHEITRSVATSFLGSAIPKVSKISVEEKFRSFYNRSLPKAVLAIAEDAWGECGC